ncbi:hypothetical protein [Bacillus thuringiensis]|uniref:hypothetical protein n=1 Tax=Bacillus thuringiensis TaxID=1428 RepID=UPI003F5B8EA7
MLVQNNKSYIKYCDTLVDKVYKILPLYEEENVGLVSNVRSLVIESYGLQGVVQEVGCDSDYVTLLATLEGMSRLLSEDKLSHQDMKREVFKCINLVKKMKTSAREMGDKYAKR